MDGELPTFLWVASRFASAQAPKSSFGIDSELAGFLYTHTSLRRLIYQLVASMSFGSTLSKLTKKLNLFLQKLYYTKKSSSGAVMHLLILEEFMIRPFASQKMCLTQIVSTGHRPMATTILERWRAVRLLEAAQSPIAPRVWRNLQMHSQHFSPTRKIPDENSDAGNCNHLRTPNTLHNRLQKKFAFCFVFSFLGWRPKIIEYLWFYATEQMTIRFFLQQARWTC